MKQRTALFGLLDRYVARLFCLSYLTAFFLVVGLFLIIDMATNLDDYLSADAEGHSPPVMMVVTFYGLQLPFIYLQVSPYVTLVAGMFTATKLTRYREVIAALNAGWSSRRMFFSVYLGAAVLCAGMFGLRELATGSLGERRDSLYGQLKEKRERPLYEKFSVLTNREDIHVQSYRPGSEDEPAQLIGITLRFREGTRSISISADRAEYLSAGRWALEGGRKVISDDQGQHSSPHPVLEEILFYPRDCYLSWKGKERALDLSFSETLTLLERSPTTAQYKTLLHYHLTLPLAGLVLLLVGLPFALGNQRGHGSERIAKGFFLCVAYFAADFVSRTVGLEGQLAPLYAGWLPTLLFGSLGVVFTASMRT